MRASCSSFQWPFEVRISVARLIAVTLVLASSVVAKAQAQGGEIALRVSDAVELEFQSASGVVYDVQASVDNKVWRTVGESYFGDGAKVVDLISYRDQGVRSQFFRLRTRNARDVGIGPVSLAGATYLMNDGGALRTLRFENAATGNLSIDGESSDSFRYGFLKTGPSNGRLQILFNDESSETVQMNFATDAAGTFQCQRIDSEETVGEAAGTFSRIYLNGDVTLDRGINVGVPVSPIGYSLVLFSEDQTKVIRILNDIVVKESMLNSSSSYRYDYAVADDVGQLTIWKSRGQHDFYEFEFSSVGSGKFRRSQYLGNTLMRSDSGVFSVFGAPSSFVDGQAIPLDADGGLVHFPESPEMPRGDTPPKDDVQCEMPSEMEGICVEVTANGKSEKLCFYTDGTGSLVKDLVGTSTFVPFEYDYEPESANVGRVVMEFATADGEERIVYELRLKDGCEGSYTRISYLNDRVTGKETGQFSMSAELLVPDREVAGGVAIIANPNRIGVAANVARTTILNN